MSNQETGTNPIEFGQRLKAARKQAGMTQTQLAELSGIAQAYISAAENPMTIRRLAAVFGLNVEDESE